MSEMYSVDIDNTPHAFEHVFKIINQHSCADWRMKIDTKYSNSSEIYLVFDTHFEEITLSDVPNGDEMNLMDIMKTIDGDDNEDYDEWDNEEDVIEIKTTETNQTEENQIKKMENKTMTTQEIMNAVTIINTVNMMLGTGKTARISSKIDEKIETYIIIANADRVDERSINTKLFDTKEELIRVALFGEEKLEKAIYKEPEYPVHYDALVDFATWCKDQFIENDEDAVKKIREEYRDNTSLMNFMEIPEDKRKFKVVICNKKQKMKREKEIDFATMIIIPMDEDYDPENYVNPSYDCSAFVDEDNEDVSCYENNDWEMLDYDMDYTTDDDDLTIDEIREKYDVNDIYNFDKYEDD